MLSGAGTGAAAAAAGGRRAAGAGAAARRLGPLSFLTLLHIFVIVVSTAARAGRCRLECRRHRLSLIFTVTVVASTLGRRTATSAAVATAATTRT